MPSKRNKMKSFSLSCSRSRRSNSQLQAFTIASMIMLLIHAPAPTLAITAPLTNSATQFNAYVDTSFSCPVLITCPQVCVGPNVSCPNRCDADLDQVLCDDGVCRATCPPEATKNNPCTLPCASKACPATTKYQWACEQEYGAYYDAEQTCVEQQAALSQTATSTIYTALPFTVFAAIVIVTTFSVWIWNLLQRRNKGDDTTTQILCDSKTAPTADDDADEQHHSNVAMQHAAAVTVTGYTSSMFGSLLYGTVLTILCAFQFFLFGFAVTSYRAKSQTESLVAFEVTWSIGFVYTLLFKYPTSIVSVFWRKVSLQHATTVGLTTPRQVAVAHSHRDPKYVRKLRALSAKLSVLFHAAMGCFFAMPRSGKLSYLTVRKDVKGTRYIVHEFRRYNYNVETQVFEPGDLVVVDKIGDVIDAAHGLTSLKVERRLRVVGPNAIEMATPSAWRTLSEEFHKPFYVYQLFMLWSWVPLYYFYLAAIHGLVIITGGLAVAWFKYRNESNLFKLTHVEGDVDCLRDGTMQLVPQAELVPGDVVQVASGKTYSDMILVSSEGLLVDESALTGESTPMAKKAVDAGDREQTYNSLQHKKHTISAGTIVVESEVKNNLAVVVKTGSYTSKGELLREVFSYERHQFKFDVEVGYVLFILFIEAIIGFVLVTQFLDDQPVYSWFYGMYIIAAIIPPLLPTVFTVSVGISDNRLSRKRIACNNSQDILIAGKVTRALFDKTGTLTRQGLDFVSAHCRETWTAQTASLSDDLVTAMSCCHGLHKSMNGELIGNPVDRTMFDASKATWKEARGSSVMRVEDKHGNSIEVLKVFDFDHHRMTQSVIAKKIDGTLIAYVKGSGESIAKVCSDDSIPSDYEAEVNESHKSGSYVIAIAKKQLPEETDIHAITRDQVERDLEFEGVINFKNVIRKKTASVIRQLEAGEVQCIIVTGDNLLTGIRIAKEAGMIETGINVYHCSRVDEQGKLTWLNDSDQIVNLPPLSEMQSRAAGHELAVTGEVWEATLSANPDYAKELAQCIRVYGRCNPFHKVSVVNTFVEMGFITMMCGDGGNDCGALKSAHVGVALSDAEASIVSPFTSLDKEIESVLDVLREGRCALASALASYKYILMYGQLEGIDNLIMAFFRINLTEYAWAMLDGIWVVCMAFTLPLAHAARRLSDTRPTASLLGPHTVASLCGVLFSNIFYVLFALAILYRQDWMQCRKWDNEDVSNLMIIGDNYESEVLFLVTGYQFLSTAMAFNFGYEFRQSWIKNYKFVACIAVFTALHFYITLVPGRLSCVWRVNCSNKDLVYSVSLQGKVPIQNPYASTVMPLEFRITLIIIMVLNALTNMGWDYFIVNRIRQYLGRKRRREVQLVSAKSGGEVAETV
ncbi:hypothetical protein MPSEU_000585800 [Mayamaea pseudoterrestris]|nr:hypothetical protein MPSEU_000585800 [Mayamaea pseudoterrestris]